MTEGLLEPLTEREQRVLELLSLGKTNREIASRMCVCEDTVKYHLKNVYGKFGAHSRTQAVVIAQQSGLIAPTAEAATPV